MPLRGINFKIRLLTSRRSAIAALSEVQSIRLPGTLGQAEEYGGAVAEKIRPFLGSVVL